MKATYLVKIPTQRARSLVYDPVSISSETLVTVYKEHVPCKWCQITLATGNLGVDAIPRTV